MSNIIPVQNQLPAMTRDQLDLIKRTVAKGATDNELQLFLYRCQSMGLDPLKSGQIHFVKYGNGAGTIVVGIEGFRAIAHRTGRLSGIKRGAIKDEQGKLVGAWAEVYRTDWTQPAREEVPLEEYNTGRGPWQKMPETMIKKVAEAAALRMAFPNDLGGTYVREEMDQAEEKGRITPNAGGGPTEEDGVLGDLLDLGIIPFGKYARRRPHEIDESELRKYVDSLDALEEKKGLTEQQKTVRDFIVDYLTKIETEATV